MKLRINYSICPYKDSETLTFMRDITPITGVEDLIKLDTFELVYSAVYIISVCNFSSSMYRVI